MVADSMLCTVWPRLARWVIVAVSHNKRDIHVLDKVTFMSRRNAQRWIYENAPKLGAGYFEARRISNG